MAESTCVSASIQREECASRSKAMLVRREISSTIATHSPPGCLFLRLATRDSVLLNFECGTDGERRNSVISAAISPEQRLQIRISIGIRMGCGASSVEDDVEMVNTHLGRRPSHGTPTLVAQMPKRTDRQTAVEVLPPAYNGAVELSAEPPTPDR